MRNSNLTKALEGMMATIQKAQDLIAKNTDLLELWPLGRNEHDTVETNCDNAHDYLTDSKLQLIALGEQLEKLGY